MRLEWRRATLGLVLGLIGALLGAVLLDDRLRPRADAERYAFMEPPPGDLPRFWNVPEFDLPDQHGRRVTERALAGHVWIAGFFFTTCTSVCPTLTAKLRLLQRELADPDLRFVSFSVDPERDTVESLLDYQRRWSPDESRWLLLRNDPKSLSEIARGMHVVAERIGDERNPISHTSLFFLVDATGSVRGAYDANDRRALARLVADARRLLHGSAAPADAGAEPSGDALFAALGCAGCHDDARLAPSLVGIWGQKVALEGGRDATVDDAYLRESIVAPAYELVRGYLPLMPSYEDALTRAEIAALVRHVGELARAQAGTPASGGAASSQDLAAERAGVEPPAARTSVDPVCGMTVRATEDAPQAEVGGRKSYFCSEGCRDRFTEDPSAYGGR